MLQNHLRRRELRCSARADRGRALKHLSAAAVTGRRRTMKPAWAGGRSRRVEAARNHSWTRYLRAFWDRAYRENVTGLSGMVAYNLLFALFPFALLILFVVGPVLGGPGA